MPVCLDALAIYHPTPDCPKSYCDTSYKCKVVCRGYRVEDLGTKKEDDLFHLLNLVCLKYTGHYLPADGETSNIHKYILRDGKKLCITPPLNPLSIMSYSIDNSIAHQVKRMMICDKIKKMYEYQDFYPSIARKLAHNPKFFDKIKLHRDNLSVDVAINSLTDHIESHYGMKRQIEEGIKEIAYEILMGSNDDPTLIPLIRKFGNRDDYFADLTDKDKCVSYIMTTQYSKNRILPRTDLSWCSQENNKIRQHLGSAYTPENIQDFLKSNFLEHKYFIPSRVVDKGVGDTHITKANKIRKGKEYDVFCRIVDCWGVGGWDIKSPTSLNYAIDDNRLDEKMGLERAWEKVLNSRYLVVNTRNIIRQGGQLNRDIRQGYWSRYKKAGGSLSSDYFIKMATGKTNVCDVEGKLVSMFC